ncbi:ABC transporter permease [Chloroflexus sp.]|uniref:ABC transporter permease n=1 Tax=Chloroflexus sp. TaxID=1904827 RepID=UPI00260801E8|nr:ABC transporter permease [uncultured Chloroflexus sp.]
MEQLLIDLAAVLAAASPLVIAAMGETLSERAGVINLSLDGTMLLSAMTGFAVALITGNLILGFIAAALVGALVAAVLGLFSLTLGQSQTAVGFVLALLCTDLSSFLGAPFARVPGPSVPFTPIPVLSDLPVFGPLFFRHDPVIYASLLIVPFTAFLLYGTRLGLIVRALGERPAAVYARGVDVTRWRYAMLIAGGALVGIAGAAFSLDLKQGWSYRHTFGSGWIVLAIVIFGGWRPWRVALGCYLFAALELVATRSQSALPDIPTQIVQVAPFVLMILVLALVNLAASPAAARQVMRLPAFWQRPLLAAINRLRATAPAALGQPFERP